MTTHADTAAPGEDLGTAARRMIELGRKRLPVVEDGRVVGIVSRPDVLRPYHRSDEAIAADLAVVLGELTRVPEAQEVRPSVRSGVVALDGTVQWPRDVTALEAIVARVPGVVAVDNRLASREPEPRLDRAHGRP
jgi:CBS domain-containing protein